MQKENDQYSEEYYAFNWGDGLFIVLNPYLYTENKPNKNGWEWTLGKEQYPGRTILWSHSSDRYLHPENIWVTNEKLLKLF